MGKLRHGSLFTGIGGFDLGLEWAGFETAWQVENNEFCQAVLAKQFPGVQRFLDIKSVGQHNLTPVDIISGGFPCQDISVGASFKERGLGGERSGLWSEYARIVRELRPTWVLIENVPNLKDHGADTVIAEMEDAGYSCWPSVVGADTFRAPFQRRRVFILCRNNANGYSDIGSDMGAGWEILPECQRKVEEACQNWKNWEHELGTGNARSLSGTEESEVDSYARGVRAVYGVPDWMDRLKALGNCCLPVIPAIIGSFVQNYELLRQSGQ